MTPVRQGTADGKDAHALVLQERTGSYIGHYAPHAAGWAFGPQSVVCIRCPAAPQVRSMKSCAGRTRRMVVPSRDVSALATMTPVTVAPMGFCKDPAHRPP